MFLEKYTLELLTICSPCLVENLSLLKDIAGEFPGSTEFWEKQGAEICIFSVMRF